MTLGAPLALLGLLALPLVWWLHKRLRRPPELVLPSLMFLQDEDDASRLPSGRRLDAELLLALAATALLAFAAAGPELVRSAPRRVVRVAVSGGGPGLLRGYAAAARAARDEIRAALGPGGELDVVWVPPVDSLFAPRPTDEALLAAAMAGPASARVVVSDRPPSVDTGPIGWIAVGSPERSNTGIVAVSIHADATGRELFCAVAHDGPAPARGAVALSSAVPGGPSGRQAFELAPGRVATFRFPLPGEATGLTLGLVAPDGGDLEDDLPADNEVTVLDRVLPVHVDPGLPAGLHARIDLALEAVQGVRGVRRVPLDAPQAPALAFVRRGRTGAPRGTWLVELEPVAEGAAAVRASEGTDALGSEPLVADLSTAGPEWVYARGAAEVAEGECVLLGRRAGGRVWPVVLVRERVVRLAPDPSRGEPRAVDAPFWPLLVENLVEQASGRGIGQGYRAQGLLDPASSRPGRARMPFDPALLAGTRPSVPGRTRPLRPLLVVGALACLGLLWAAPRIRRRLTPRPALAGTAG